jgi:hypothetical protein
MKVKTITLEVDEWHTIMDAVSFYQDEGPAGAGWRSIWLDRCAYELGLKLSEAKITDLAE